MRAQQQKGDFTPYPTCWHINYSQFTIRWYMTHIWDHNTYYGLSPYLVIRRWFAILAWINYWLLVKWMSIQLELTSNMSGFCWCINHIFSHYIWGSYVPSYIETGYRSFILNVCIVKEGCVWAIQKLELKKMYIWVLGNWTVWSIFILINTNVFLHWTPQTIICQPIVETEMGHLNI